MTRKGNLIKKIAVLVLASIAVTSFSSCSVKSKRQLMEYARSTYGDADLVKAHSNLGKDIVTVTMKDKDTGIEYQVTSTLEDVNVDGSSFGKAEHTSSDFEEKYAEYLMNKAGSTLSKIAERYKLTYEFDYGVITVTFEDRESSEFAEEAVKKVAEAISEYDVKKMAPAEYTVMAEGNVYVGYYNSLHNEYVESSEFYIIDYVHEKYDPEAEFQDSMFSYITQFLSYEEVEEYFPGHDGAPSGNAYYFKDKDGDIFVAIDLKEFGAAKSEIRLYRDTASGMEQIDY